MSDFDLQTEEPLREVALEIDSEKTGAELATEIYDLLKEHYKIEGIMGR